ncbi:hypothetical protein EHQ43_11725 [Leptospira bouyouniensis]|uniref:Uncharacterized protein n=1 Tax=Leptospira bouyouniensis TaxID=2484911 RepID=A0A7I0HPE5_9LEPT|nr:hypothetical protein [Leptospira bouyouniensis]TGL04067.1 hypothetical protein EHQ43_11725 [Leptospira bouyouniensis]
MKKIILLRISAGLLLFHLIGHSFGNATWDESDDPLKQSVIRGMIDHKFYFMGTNRSMGEYYYGYGLITSILLIYTSLILLILSYHLNKNKEISLFLIWLSTAITISLSAVEFIYFFPFAGITTLLASICIFYAGIDSKIRKE